MSVSERFDVAIVGSGFAGSLLARMLATQGLAVVLLERGTHPRFAIGESSTPLASLSLERIARRCGLRDCYDLATHGRWIAAHPELRRGLKRGFTFYRHHPGGPFADRGLASERLLVAASPNDHVADTHWLRADVDHHFVHAAVAAGVHYADHIELSGVAVGSGGVQLTGTRNDAPFAIEAGFVVDASGANGFLARQLGIPSALDRVETHSALLASHFDGVGLMAEVLPTLPPGPYPDDWAAVHHIIEEGWMYSLRFDDGVTSAGFALTPEGVASLKQEIDGGDVAPVDTRHGTIRPDQSLAAVHQHATRLWHHLLQKYPTIGALFAHATSRMPITLRPRMQHRLARATGERWALLPSAYAFVDPLFSTGIAWSLRAVERLARCFDGGQTAGREPFTPSADALARYDDLLAREADQIDLLVAGAYAAMPRFDDFVAQTMLYFAAVSFAESHERLAPRDDDPWTGLFGIDDPLLAGLPRQSLERLRQAAKGTMDDPHFAEWIAAAIAPRNVAALADPARHNLYPADLDALVERHALLGLTRDQVVAALPALRGMTPEPDFA